MKHKIKRLIAAIKFFALVIVGVCAAAYVVYAGYVVYMSKSAESVVPAPVAEVIEEVQEIIEEPVSDVEQAEKMLAEATAKLDAEETRLLAEIDAASSTYHEIREDREAKIAEINAIRASF